MRRPAPLLLAVLLVAGCGGETVEVSVEMTLDPGTCGIEAPDALLLSCEATAGVWLRTASGALLDEACVDFASLGGADGPQDEGGGEGDGPVVRWTLADLTPLLADIDLSTASNEDVQVEVAVYAPWAADSGCLTIEEIMAGDQLGPELIVWGSSAPARLADSSLDLDLLLLCGSLAGPAEPDACAEQCTEAADDCRDASELIVCDEQFEACDDQCTGPDCEKECGGQYVDCVLAEPTGGCELDWEQCFEDCGENGSCVELCDREVTACIDATCNGQYEECEQGCPDAEPGGECASVAGET